MTSRIPTPAAISALAERVVAENRAAGRTIALAESCTGGMVAAAITDVPGSSDVLLASLVTYSNESKHQLLGVAKDIIDTFGAVSAACAWAMARGAQARTDADIAVAITGIAGPDGGSEKKPVGTVIFGRAERSEPAESAQTRDYRFDPAEGRSGIRRQAVAVALELLLPVP